jgi:hypothetical protein
MNLKVWRNAYHRSQDLSIPYPNTHTPSQNYAELDQLVHKTVSYILIAYYMRNSSWPRRNGRETVFIRQPVWLEQEKGYSYIICACMDHSQSKCHLC